MARYVDKSLKGYCKASNLAFNEKIKEMRALGEDICHLAFGQSPFPVPRSFVEELKAAAHVNDYLPVAGLPEFRRAIADLHNREDGLDIDETNVIVGPGTKELIYLAMRIFDGDVILPDAAWTTYAPQSRLAKKTLLTVPTTLDGRWLVTPESLARTIERDSKSENRLLIITTPGNPSGTSYTEAELKALSQVCKEKNVVVLSDEIYSRLTFASAGGHASMAKVFPEQTLLTTGFSKMASAGGWRVGYMIVPDGFRDSFGAALVSAASHTYSCAPAPMQIALTKGLTDHREEMFSYLAKCNKIMETMMTFCVRELVAVGVRVQPAAGGYYLMPDFEVVRPALVKLGVTTGNGFCDLLLKEEKVSLMGGEAFLRPVEEFSTRFCFVDFDGTAALEALEEVMQEIGVGDASEMDLDEAFLAKVAPNMVEAMKRIKRFVTKYSQ